jgi:serine protease
VSHVIARSAAHPNATAVAAIEPNDLTTRRHSAGSWLTEQEQGGSTSPKVAISGGSVDADLYVRKGSQSTSSFGSRPYLTGNTENCNFTGQ